ncbi:methyl-accepting chemotaxis protein [Planctomicrobium sp. SH664]|uniref:methyl-accepting chemotaxis protein n=1 Tax=Planctomicrobium sp. SH664 TaxID=3448125 RepID=UPI003F5C9355
MRWTIGRKLGFGFGSLLLLMGINSLIIYRALDRMSDAAEAMSNEAVPALRACDDMMISLNRATSATRGYLVLSEDPSAGSYFETEFTTAINDVDVALQDLERCYGQSQVPAEQARFAEIREGVPVFQATQTELRDAARRLGKGADRDLTDAVSVMQTRSLPKAQEIRVAARALRDLASERVTAERALLDTAGKAARWTLLVTASLGIGIGCLVAFLLSHRIVQATQSLLAGVKAVASGDLTLREIATNSKDEIGDLTTGFNSMVASLRSILSETASTTGEVAVASQQIAAGAQQQLSSLNQTASSLNQITTTAEEFKATMQEFADRTKAVHEAADETAKRASEGRGLTLESSSRIEQVRANAVTAGESVLNLADQMQRIGEITASVNEIAEQTKLLALNASIEAARAGEEGRGFAVVAMQVRELANQSKEAAGRIEGLITQTQRSMHIVVQKIEEGGRLSDDSRQMVQRVSHAFEEIVRAIEQTREAMSQINTGARQQELGLTELVASITEIDGASKESLAAAEQTQKSIVSIDQRIRLLNHTISRFTT